MNRYKRIERNLEAVGVSVTAMYEGEARGSRLLERARLSLSEQRLILVGSRYSLQFEEIAESMAMQYPDFRPPPAVLGRDGLPIKSGTPKRPRGARGAGFP